MRYLYNQKLTTEEESLFNYEEYSLYNVLIGQSRVGELDHALLATLKESSPATVVLFSSLYGLMAKNGESALPLALMAWYKKTFSVAVYQAAVEEVLPFIAISPKAEAAPAMRPLANTGAQHIAAGKKMAQPTGPILPKPGQRNILITSALPYVNNVPHLGNIVGSVLSADIFARYAKARNYNALYICGTDEYGTATETKALEEKVTPRELCDKYNALHKGVYEWFQIGFDHFGRTSTPQQTEIAQDIFLKLWDNGYLEEKSMEQLYCTHHNGYLADRFVEGTCPKCGYDDARGDQCDNCGQLLNPFELINPRCKIDNQTPEKRETNHVFISLDKLQDQIAQWNERSQVKGNWSRNARTITQNWLKEGLRPRAITRDLKWGVPVPLEAYKEKVLYVWFDACMGYISITANYSAEWAKWWKDPDNVQLYQFMGKDNVPFHTVVFPGSQLGTNEKWTMLHHLSTTEYLQYEGGKFSKSRNIGVFGNNAQEIGVSPSVWRYYLACARPETSDTQFSWQEFVSRNNNELLANLGNFVNRLVKFVIAKYNGVVPEFKPEVLKTFEPLRADVDAKLAEYIKAMENSHLRQGLEIAMHVSSRGNHFLQDNKLDNSLFTNSRTLADAVVGVGLNLIYLVSALVYPFMPETAEGIVEQLNAPLLAIPDNFQLPLLAGHCIGKAKYLFKRIEESKVDEWRKKYGSNSK